MYDVGEEYLEYGVSSPEVMELQWFLKAQGTPGSLFQRSAPSLQLA
jgi:hypothetical protein